MNKYQAKNGGYACAGTWPKLQPNLRCRECAKRIGRGEYADDIAPVHYDRDHATPGAHFRVFRCYDSGEYPNPYAGACLWPDYEAYCAALDELSSAEVAERLGWRSPW